ncbi:MAG: hypothetical protein IKV96_01675, partial [Firmicutes bacterium]|nr:hypothetical protein [Bacillota bacterium]
PSVVLFMAASAAAFIAIPEKSDIFWVSFAAIVAAFGLSIFSGFKTAEDTDTPSCFMFSTISGFHFTTVVASILIFAVKFHIAIRYYAALQVLILGVFAALIILGDAGHNYIQAQEEELRNHSSFNRK